VNDTNTLIEMTRALLRACVDLVAPGCQPRAGQAALTDDIAAATGLGLAIADGMDQPCGQLIGCAPVGVGKTFAELAAAWVASARLGRRTVVSTESLGLQAQIIGKDAPVVASAAERLGLPPVAIAVHKGWSNYACLLACAGLADLDGTPSLEEVEEILTAVPHPSPAQSAALWGIRQAMEGGDGDRHSYPGDCSDMDWAEVSVQSTDCPHAACPFHDVCLPRAAREAASLADIVVTNHTLIAIQATTGAPVVTGNKDLGLFDTVIVDECHALPGHVRNQGSTEVSGMVVRRLVAHLDRLTPLAGGDPAHQALVERGRIVADMVADAVAPWVSADQTTRLDIGVRPLGEVMPTATSWLRAVYRHTNAWLAQQHDGSKLMINLSRILAKAEDVNQAFATVNDPPAGVARWAELQTLPAPKPSRTSGKRRSASSPTSVPVLKTSPVDVSGMLTANLWHTPMTGTEVNAVCLSATVPPAFGGTTGLPVGTTHYESAFARAYQTGTALLIPAAPTGVLVGTRLDLPAHQRWAGDQIATLVKANHGSALVLAATTANGKAYAELLRSRLAGVRVLSQWDDRSLKLTVDEWTTDQGSILVGTRSLMTGVDAPGATNTLVIVDRVPRAAPNPVDDARVLDVAQRGSMGRWDADRIVYYGDARTLLAQATGRLIRKEDDWGLVAILDPRLSDCPGSYKRGTKAFLLKAVEEFGTRLTSVDDAIQWISAHAPAR